MPRKPLQRSSVLPYHVTARSNNREDFPVDLSTMWQVLGTECLTARMNFGVEFQAVVLMPNHFHMIMTIPENDLGNVMNQIMRNLAKTVNRLAGRLGHVFGGPYKPSIINNSRYYTHAFKYVYRNPVRAKLCDSVEEYAFSTLSGLLGKSHLPFPISCPRKEFSVCLPGVEIVDMLEWLNTPFSKENELLIQAGLRKRVFEKVICSKTRVEPEEMRCLI